MLAKVDGYSKQVDIFPLVKYYMDQLGLFTLFKKHVPKKGAELEPSEGLCLLVVNISPLNHPLYKVEEWLADYADGKGEVVSGAAKYNDDRLARRCLDGLYKADRNSLMMELSANAIKIHELETLCYHNDTTSVSFSGSYDNVGPSSSLKIVNGYNKDGRKDCKQIVFGVNVTADGYVPISYNVYDGNTSDSDTHIPNWENLRELLRKENFIYIADSKACDEENLGYIAGKGGKFITMMPATRSEVKEFHNRLIDKKVSWQEGYQKENSRKRGEFTTYQVYENKSREGF